jgi:GNAT superfamily N-acetyltransferase
MEFVYLADRQDAIPVVAKWYFNQWGYLSEVPSLEKMTEILRAYLNRDHIPLIILAVNKDQILGAVQLKYYEMDIYPNKEHWLGGVYVPQQYRGKRIARKLVLRAVDVAKSYGVNTLFLQTEKINGGLYKRLGWETVERVIYREKLVLVMKKEL